MVKHRQVYNYCKNHKTSILFLYNCSYLAVIIGILIQNKILKPRCKRVGLGEWSPIDGM